MAAVPLGLLLLFVPAFLAQSANHRRFEYKHSFRAPNLAQRDGSIPFWMVTGDAIASSEQLRLAPSMRSRRGIAWNKRAFIESPDFEVEMAFKVTGQGRVGADGLALWYTSQQGTLGPVFGSNDYWNGLGVMFDSFDNDGKKDNPYVSVMINDGTRSYDHQTDGTQQVLTGCQRDFRNKPFPVHMRLEYIKNVLTVYLTDGLTQQHRFELCMRAENIFLPRNGYFGVSAATGALADDHDVLDFSVYSVFDAPPKPNAAQPIPQDERQKYDAEFEKQMQDYEKERQKFKEQNPDKAKPDNEEEEYAKYFEDSAARELRLIYETQNAIHQVMQQMEAKLQQIQQQQGVHTSMLQQGGGHVPQQPAGGQPPQGGVPGAGFQAHEKNEVIQGVRDLTASIRDMKNYVNEIFTRTYNLEQKFLGPNTAGAGGGDQMKQQLENIQNDIRQIRASQIAQGNAPNVSASGDCSSCVTSTLFVLIALVQSGVIITFIFIRSKADKAKFY